MTRIALMGATLSLVAYAKRGGANDTRRLLPSVAARGGANRMIAARGGANRDVYSVRSSTTMRSSRL